MREKPVGPDVTLVIDVLRSNGIRQAARKIGMLEC